ncbi:MULTISPECIES: hypothetical protein [Paraburkholderia]|uniref:hypothetical protein n=1 Tax=Paraburkholderia TaxID=1822464 RepID=UPI00036DCCA5|nr:MULTISPECIES: hypothetical protein [Paraburkholderia]MDH6151765.1 hypothetical protein [Paraburkholderia sp. WSM4179]
MNGSSTQPPTGADNSQMGFLAGYKFPTAFELAYDSQKKVLTATVRVKIVPVDMFKADSTGRELLGPDGKKQSVPYDHDVHGRYGVTVDTPVAGGYVARYRDGPDTTFDVPTRRQHVESVLNAHSSVLVLDGCSKGAACGGSRSGRSAPTAMSWGMERRRMLPQLPVLNRVHRCNRTTLNIYNGTSAK